MRTPAPLPEEDPRFEFDVTEQIRQKANQKPGVAEDPKDLATKVGTWVGLGLLVWAVLLGVIYVTVKFIQHIT